ncbi:MAG TPA: alanine dehydrogenase [Chitinophagales bacterium]|nr:alanine dehydrogenase [Chitinophagales bacterium]HMU97505.1 alanine dehydrogenase [Chitinophagales bacterium]HMW95288.1 alanine dehydrogenase [Chitinophagales bacterium]HMY43386.1 alanine dehydrogenase [Chitinophagales bacterium]HMZ69586.1 alanine dehydrogenase [Chitinophagales bacterium]
MEAELLKSQINYALYPQEVLAAINTNSNSVSIGIPREDDFQENRIPLTPNSVASLVSLGCRVTIEADAGTAANFYDEAYINAGADIVYDKDAVFKMNTILKSAPISARELSLIQNNQTIISPILLPSMTKNCIKTLINKKVTALAFEYIKGEHNTFPILRSMSEIVGNYSVSLAAQYLSGENGRGILFGGIAGQPPAKLVIIGAGTVGENACRVALALGASVAVFDDNIYRLTRLQNNLGVKVYTSVLDPINLAKNLSRADVVIGALSPENGKTPLVVSEDMVRGMKKGAVIIDVDIDGGGSFETAMVTTNEQPIYVKHNVIHYCVPNIASNVPKTASYAMSNVLAPILKNANKVAGIEQLIKFDAGFRNGVYIYKGALTKPFIAQQFELKYTNLELILSADF